MINSNNLKATLKALGFVSGSDGDFLTKEYQNVDATMSVDFEKKQLIFSKLIEGRDRNVGFDRNENFVVFECVDRLLTKGYRPENIQLEKEWHLGHDAKSGRADVCVTDEQGSMLFIVECKTWGKEFDKAKKTL